MMNFRSQRLYCVGGSLDLDVGGSHMQHFYLEESGQTANRPFPIDDGLYLLVITT